MPENSTKLQSYSHSESPVSLAVISAQSQAVYLSVHAPHLMLYWKLGKASPVARLDGHNSSVSAAVFGEDERILASGSEAGTVMIWDISVQRAVASLKGSRSAVTSLALGKGSQSGLLAVSSADGVVRLWDSRAKDTAATLVTTHPGCATSVEISPNSDLVASGCAQGTISLWDIGSQRVLHEFDLAEVSPYLLAFHPTQEAFVSAGLNRQLTAWDLKTFAPTLEMHLGGMIQSITFDPSAKCLFVATGTEIQAVEVEKWSVLGCIEGGLSDIMDISSNANALVTLTSAGNGIGIWSTDFSAVISPDSVHSPVPFPVISIPSAEEQSQALLEVSGNHAIYLDLLKKKKENLATVAQWWTEANVNATIGSLSMLKDVPVSADVLQAWVVESSAEMVQLEHLPLLLPLCHKLIESKYESFVKVGLAVTHTLMGKFKPILTNSLLDGVQREDQSRRCEVAVNSFAQIMNSQALLSTVSRKSKIGAQARQLAEELEMLVWACRRRPVGSELG